ncbi:MAG: hypothetical protein ACI84E_001242, partial [Planctomycetota bacterium]
EPVHSGPESGDQPPTAPTKSWPDGAVLAAGDVPILQSEVDRTATWVKLLYPEDTQPSLRRKALTHIHLNRAALANTFPEQRAEALADAQRVMQDLGKPNPPTPSVVTGRWSDLSLEIWGEVRDFELDVFRGPIELTGRWVLLRLDSATPGLVPAADRFTVSMFEFSFTPPDFDSQVALNSQSVLTVIDPAWEFIVPSAWGKSLPDSWYAGPK